MNRCLSGIFLFVLFGTAHAWTIGAKGRVSGPAIHTTNFLTPNNQSFIVRAQAYMGSWVNGTCQPNSPLYDLGVDNLQTGNFVDIDAFQLKTVMGGGYTCMMVFYNNKQMVNEVFQLTWDGFNYTNTIPETAAITIL